MIFLEGLVFHQLSGEQDSAGFCSRKELPACHGVFLVSISALWTLLVLQLCHPTILCLPDHCMRDPQTRNSILYHDVTQLEF